MRVEDGLGNVTRIRLERYGRRFQLSDPDSGVQSTAWNAFGEVKQTVDGNGQMTTYEYDALGRKVVRRDGVVGGDALVTSWYFDGERMGRTNMPSAQET